MQHLAAWVHDSFLSGTDLGIYLLTAGAGALPENWSEAKDAQGRVYFWHTKTKKVQWDRPTADTPVK